ncbi:MAG: alpha/beta hydrolase [Planctomycetes bacterium]|nr:alpha/beta hydrolase [Planctomycetota bacterium]
MPAAAFALFLLQAITPNFTDVPYGSKPLEKLDVYMAPSPTPTPAVIEIHPGGWSSGAKSSFSDYGGAIEKIYSRGITIVSINYPLAPADLYPVQNLSCQRAVQFVRANAQAWNIDPNNIASIGMSAGAHLGMWVGMSPDAGNASSNDPVLQQSSRLRAIVSIRGPSDFTSQYYKYVPQPGDHGSPIWQYFGVTTQHQWDGIPVATKQAASPRYLASGAASVINANVSFLALHDGDATITSSTQLPAPETNVHSLIFGMIMREALHAIGSIDAEVWAGTSIEDPTGSFFTGDMIADWLNNRLRSSSLSNYGFGTPGCYGSLFLVTNGDATVGNPNFSINCYIAGTNPLGAVLFDTYIMPDYSDPFGIGIRLWMYPLSTTLFAMDATLTAGTLNLSAPIPNNPMLSGSVFYAQGLSVWNGIGTPVGCSPSPFQLSTSNVLRFQIP